jgi:hypothetical protein
VFNVQSLLNPPLVRWGVVRRGSRQHSVMTVGNARGLESSSILSVYVDRMELFSDISMNVL